MKIRLANKIFGTTFLFKNWDSNYQPYSIPQQAKAISKIKCGIDMGQILRKGMVKKVPLKYRKRKGFLPGEFESCVCEIKKR